MSEHLRDRIAGAILVVFAAVWCIVVRITVPTAYGDAIVGPRDAPLWLGMVLGLLALLLIVRSFTESPAPAIEAGEAVASPASADRVSEWKAIGAVAGSLIVYALFMEWFGFVVATVVVVFTLLRYGLGVRSPKVLLGMPLIMGFGIFYVFGSLMGVYLPHGTVISPF
jgi:hypothetical protein